GDPVVAGPAADDVVALAAVDDVVAVAADHGVVAVGAVEQRRAVLERGVEPGVAGRTAVAETADGMGGAPIDEGETSEEPGGGGGDGQSRRVPPEDGDSHM